ncbi:MAG: hypothetical protein IJ848_03645 [Alphaproteobacteria bacterium]|nr:hypothetical protein [Alphaproteobacteria bacterium]
MNKTVFIVLCVISSSFADSAYVNNNQQTPNINTSNKSQLPITNNNLQTIYNKSPQITSNINNNIAISNRKNVQSIKQTASNQRLLNSNVKNKIQQNQMVLHKNNNKQIYNYDKATGAYVLQQNNVQKIPEQNESIYEFDSSTGRYRLTKKAKQQITQKYDARVCTKELNKQIQNIITSINQCNNIDNLININNSFCNILQDAINKYKLTKVYVLGIWEAWYNQNIRLLNNKLQQLCGNDNNLYKQIYQLNLFNFNNAMKFINQM